MNKYNYSKELIKKEFYTEHDKRKKVCGYIVTHKFIVENGIKYIVITNRTYKSLFKKLVFRNNCKPVFITNKNEFVVVEDDYGFVMI